MKKLIAYIIALLSSLYNNVEFTQAPNDQGYQPGMYYHLETGEAQPDYRANMQITNQLDQRNVCLTSNYVAKQYDSSAESLRINDISGTDYGYWFQASTSSNPFDLSMVDNSASIINIPANAVIIAPFQCRRTTSASVTQSYPVGMSVEVRRGSDIYVLTIAGMYCWACDAYRELEVIDGTPVIVHTYTDDGRGYNKGEVLGIAGDNCTVTLTKKGAISTTVAEFYGVD